MSEIGTVCDYCDQWYDFTGQNSRIHLWLDTPEFNLVEANCSHCGVSEDIFMDTASLLIVVEHDPTIKARLHAEAPDNVREGHRIAIERYQTQLLTNELAEQFHEEVEHIEDHLGELGEGK